MNVLLNSGLWLARSSDGNPIVSTITVILFYLMFNMVEASIERLIWGERFEHFLDPVFMAMFIAYAGYGVYCCGLHNTFTEVS